MMMMRVVMMVVVVVMMMMTSVRRSYHSGWKSSTPVVDGTVDAACCGKENGGRRGHGLRITTTQIVSAGSSKAWKGSP